MQEQYPKKTIKLNYSNFYGGFKSEFFLITRILKKHYNIEISDNPDYLIYSCFYNDDKFSDKKDCIRIFYSGEARTCDYNKYDYVIDFYNKNINSHHIYAPNYYFFDSNYIIDLAKQKHLNVDGHEKELLNRNFCSFVYSNDVENRRIFRNKLSEYKMVDYRGRLEPENNISTVYGEKITFQKNYKFSIAFDNNKQDDYITEKLVDSFASNTIPIYFGANNVTKYFNEEAMIIVKDENDFDRAIERIKQIDNDDELYLHMLRQPALTPEMEEFNEHIMDDLEKFICNIFDKDYKSNLQRYLIRKIYSYLYSMYKKLFS